MIDVSSEPLPRLDRRDATSHKGDFGRGLVIGGSLGMAGAPAMSAMACLRSGAGVVSIATPACVLPTVASYHPAYMTHPLACDGERITHSSTAALSGLLNLHDASAIGPGLGRSPEVTQVVEKVYKENPKAMVVDADALFALAEIPEAVTGPAGPRVLTPHGGEFARLFGRGSGDLDRERAEAACGLASRDPSNQTLVVLKGHRTVIADRERYCFNSTGNPGMATGGSGDVLTGVILALLGQGLEPFEAARLGAHVHGLCGDLAARSFGQTSLVATDLIDHLPEAWRRIA